MPPIPLPPSNGQSSWLLKPSAAWTAIDEADADESEESESQEINPAAVDWLMADSLN